MSDHVDFEVDFEKPLDDVKEWGGESGPLVAPGTYTLTVVEVSLESGDKGPYAAVKYEVQDDGEFKGSFVYNNYSFSGKALGRVKQLMLACGAQLDKFRANEIMGATIVADIVHNVGAPKIDENGTPMEPKTFANVANERMPEGVQSEPQPEPAKAQTKASAPAQNKTQNSKPQGAARRA